MSTRPSGTTNTPFRLSPARARSQLRKINIRSPLNRAMVCNDRKLTNISRFVSIRADDGKLRYDTATNCVDPR